MSTYRHRRLVHNLIVRHGAACIVCGQTVISIDDAVIVVKDNQYGRVMSNLRLRHAACTASKHRPAFKVADITELVELVSQAKYKICPVCRKTWIGAELEQLVAAERNGVKHILHAVCLGK